MKIPYAFFQQNGFDIEVTAEGKYKLISTVTGATVYTCEKATELNTFVTGINYALEQNVDSAWKRPARETGGEIVKEFV